MVAPRKPTEIKVFIEAKSKEALVQAMLENNLKFGKKFIYDPIVKDGSKWVAWYEHDFEQEILKRVSRKEGD